LDKHTKASMDTMACQQTEEDCIVSKTRWLFV